MKFTTGRDVWVIDGEDKRAGNIAENEKHSKFIKLIMYDTLKLETFEFDLVEVATAKIHDLDMYISKRINPQMKYNA